MVKVEDLLGKLKTKGHRITPIRSRILEVFIVSKAPISATDLITNFKSAHININKTTVYRELDFLLENALVSEVEFGEGKKRYELNIGHHHHLVCVNCNKVEDVNLKVELSEEEKKIESETGFKVESHSLEFFGYCKNCKNEVS